MQKYKYRLFLSFCFAGFCAAILPATAGTVNSIPYFCGFEVNELSGEYTVDTPLINGLGGWYASSEEVVVTDQKKRAGSHSAMIPLDTTLTNLFEVNPGYTDVWVQMDVWPDLYEAEGHPSVDPTAAALFYINSNGYFVVHNGEYNPATPDAGWTEVEAGKIDETSQDWIRLNMIVDYDANRWALYANGVFVTNEIGFVDETIESFCGFALYNGGGTTYVDNVFVEHRADHNPKFTLSFDQQPVNTTAGETIPAVRVEALDVNENRMLVFTNDINIEIGNNVGGGVLSGTTNRTAAEGLATFNDLSIDKSGTGYTLSAIDEHEGVSGGAVESDAFNITHAAADHIAFTTQPGSPTSAGTAFAPQPVVTIYDAFTNVVTGGADSSKPITLSLEAGTGELRGTKTMNASAGEADFIGKNLNIDLAGADKVIRASVTLDAAGAQTADTDAFEITHAAADHIAFTTQPGSPTSAGAAFAPQPVVVIYDAFTNVVTGGADSSKPITLSLEAGAGELRGTKTMNADAGEADFIGKGLNIDLVGADKVIRASVTLDIAGAQTADTDAFEITHAATDHLVFTAQPTGVNTAGVAFAQQPVVDIRDAFSNKVTSASDNVTLELSAGTGALMGDKTVAAVSGTATFAGLSIDTPGEDKQLTASSGVLTTDTTDPFEVVYAPATVTLQDLDQVYDGTPRVVTASTTPEGLDVDITYDGEAEPPVDAGSYTVVGTINDAIYHGSTTGTLAVSKADQTIENFLPADGSVFKTTETAGLSASASSGLDVVFAVSAGPGVITGGTNLAFTGAGSVSVTASQAGDENWNPAPDVTRTYHVKRSMVKDDFTGDGRSVLWFYHQESATWFLLTPEGLMDPIQFGSPGAVPAEYDYEGDGKSNIAVYEDGAWHILLEDGATRTEYWGWPGAEAVPGDYSGDGTGDLAVYDPEGGLWFIASLAGEIIAWGEQFGGPGMTAVPGDYSGNGVTDMAVYDRLTGSWYIRTLAGEWLAWDFNFGWSETTPLTLDFDGDGRSDLAVYHRAEGMWYILTWRNEFYMIQFGWHEAEPLTGDFDGDGLDDIAVLHRDRNDAVWHLLRSVEGYGMVSSRSLRPADD